MVESNGNDVEVYAIVRIEIESHMHDGLEKYGIVEEILDTGYRVRQFTESRTTEGKVVLKGGRKGKEVARDEVKKINLDSIEDPIINKFIKDKMKATRDQKMKQLEKKSEIKKQQSDAKNEVLKKTIKIDKEETEQIIKLENGFVENSGTKSYTKIKIMQWNMKFLGLGGHQSKVSHITRTMMYEDPDVVVFEEIKVKTRKAVENAKPSAEHESNEDATNADECKEGGGPHDKEWAQLNPGEKRITEILEVLNENESSKGPWEYIMSEQVGYEEKYACFYRPNTVGKIDESCVCRPEGVPHKVVKKLFRKGFHPEFRPEKRIADKMERDKYERKELEKYATIKIGPDKTVNMKRWVENVYDEYIQNAETSKYFTYRCGPTIGVREPKQERRRQDEGRNDDSSHAFDYHPVVFTFTGVKADGGTVEGNKNGMFHVIAIHGSTGDKPYGERTRRNVPEQNVLEMSFLQEFCAQAVSGTNRQFVILLGDFNTQEKANNHMCLWDKENPNLPSTSNPDNVDFLEREPAILKVYKDAFLKQYVRAVKPSIPTNVYPFLAGLVSEPKHNDDIWVPCGIPWEHWEFSESWGRVVKIPLHVLREWDNITTDVFDSMDSCALKAMPAGGSDERMEGRSKKTYAHSMNSMLASIWSDHRPIVATIKYNFNKP